MAFIAGAARGPAGDMKGLRVKKPAGERAHRKRP